MQPLDSTFDLKLNRRKLIGATAIGTAFCGSSLFAGGSFAVAQANATPESGCGGEVNLLIRAPVTYNPLFATAGNDEQVIRAIFGSLVKMDDRLNPIPDLAESIDVSDDATVYTFTLRTGLQWSDGTPLTSADAAFTFERALNPLTGSVWAGRLSGIAGVKAYQDGTADSISGIETPDDQTLVITLEAPNSVLLLTLGNFTGFGILPQHLLADIPPDQLADHTFLEPFPGAGPFKLVTYETDQYVELARNELYGGIPAKLDRILMPIRTQAVAMAELERGEIDLLRLQFPDLDAASEIDGVSVVSVQGAGRDAINVNHTRPYLQDKRVRQAMMHAIDRQGIVDTIFRGRGEVVNADIFGPDWMLPIEGLNPYEYDPEKAKALLAEAGWDPTQKITITITPPNEDAWGPIVHQQLRDTGFDAELVQVDVNEYLRQLQEEDFDLVLGGGGTFRADPNLSARSYASASLPPAGSNWSRYSNPDADALYEQGSQTVDLDARREIYLQLAKILNEDMPNLVLWSQDALYAVNDRVADFVGASYNDNFLWNAEDWSVACK